jgi:hypothetical protein
MLLAAITSGQRLLDTISAAAEVDMHTFQANAHDTIAVAVGDLSGTGFFPQIQVLAPDNSVLATSSGQTGAGIDLVNVVQTGTYTIAVTGAGNTTGNYAVSLFRAPATPLVDADSLPLNSGQRVTGNIDLGDLDVYTFTASTHESVALAVGDLTGTAFFPQIQLFAPNGALVDSSSGQTGAGIDVANLPQTGTYYAVVRHAGDNFLGPYGLTMFHAPATQTVDADSGPITSGQRVTGSVDLGDIDVYTFNASFGESIAVALGDLTGSAFFPQLQIFGPNGLLLGSDAGQSGASVDLLNAPQTGTYSAVVRHAGDNFLGPYGLTMFRAPATQTVDADSGPITSGQRVTGTIEFGDIDVFTFSGAIGESLAVALGDLTGTAFFPLLQVYGPNGLLLGSDLGQSGASVDLLTAPQTGTYYAVVRHAGDDFIGSYGLTMVRFPATQVVDGDSGPITSGQRFFGNIDFGDMDVYTVSATAGESLQLAVGDLGGSAFFPHVQIYAPNGIRLAESSGQSGAGIDLQNVPQTGTYYAVVRHAGDDFIGSYAITVVHAPGTQAIDLDSGALISSQRHYGNVELGDIDVYTFNGSSGGAFSVAVGDLEGSAFFPQLQVFGPTGLLLFSGADQTSVAFDALNLTTTGTYYVLVRHAGDTFVGRYAIDLALFGGTQLVDPLDNDGGPIASGQSRSGATTLADLDVFTFNLASGANAAIQVNRLAGATLNPRIDVYDPNGVRLASQVGTTTATVNLTNVRIAGTYYAIVRESGDDAVGNYSLGLDVAPAADTRAPVVTATRFDFDTARQQIVFNMSESIGATFAIGDITLTNLDTGLPVPGANLLGAFNAASNEIIVQFTAFPFNALPDGNYRATLNAGSVQDTAALPLGAAVSFDFFALAGDVNRDRRVDVADLGVLASNWQQFGRPFSQGNFDYSAGGGVDVNDLGILASNWQKQVPPPAAPALKRDAASVRAQTQRPTGRLIDEVLPRDGV